MRTVGARGVGLIEVTAQVQAQSKLCAERGFGLQGKVRNTKLEGASLSAWNSRLVAVE
jgi:hypothetical protein